MRNLLAIARFEAAYQTRGAGFVATSVLFFLFTFAAVTVDDVQIGASEAVNVNSPYAATLTILNMSILGMFIPLVFLASGVIRDVALRTEGTFRSLPTGDRTILAGRYLGGMMATVLCFASVPLAFLLGSVMPWLDPETVGAFDPGSVLWAWVVFGLVNLWVAGTLLFTAANLTRSNAATWIALIVLFAGWAAGLNFLSDLDRIETAAVIEPFGLVAHTEQTRYWTALEKNTSDVALEGALLANRLLWGGVALGLLALNLALPRGLSVRRRGRAEARPVAAPAALRPVALPRVRPAPRAGAVQLWRRTAYETMGIARSFSFWIVAAICVVLAVLTLLGAGEVDGTPSVPVTRIVSQAVVGSFSLLPLVIAAYFTAELAWRERVHGFHEIVGATPTPSWVLVTAKYLAVVLILCVIGLVAVATTALWQLAHGYAELEIGQSVLRTLTMMVVPSIMLAALALFLQGLAGNKWAGIGLFLGYVVVSITLPAMGYDHRLYNFGDTPFEDYSDMNGFGHVLGIQAWWTLYYGLFTGVLVLLTFALWSRGSLSPLPRRLREVPRRLGVGMGAAAAVLLLAFAGVGGFLFYNTNVLNEYETDEAAFDRAEAYEARWRSHEFAPITTITDVSLDVELHPDERRHLSRADLVIENRTDGSIERVHLDYPRAADVLEQAVEGGSLAEADEENEHYVFVLEEPMTPGETRAVRTVMEVANRGIRNDSNASAVIGNGSAVTNDLLMPSLDWGARKIVADDAERRKRGLPEEPRAAALSDERYADVNFIARDADWVRFEATVETDADQVAVMPGALVAETQADGRAVYAYRSAEPIQNFFVLLSADYAVREDAWAGPDGQEVALQVFHHPSHDWNVERMMGAMAGSLDLFTEEFGPYQYEALRVLEFPSPTTFAQSFPNTIRFDEDFGFLGDFSDPDDLDYASATIAHEVAHQWFAHQVTVSPKAGSQLIVESLSEYASLLHAERTYGTEHMRRFLRRALDSYLRGRSAETRGEQPLVSMEGQGYLHYRKGSHVLFYLRDRIGEDVLHGAIRDFLSEWSLKSDPYPRSVDLIAAIREAAGPEHDQLITDLFERIVLYDLAVSDAQKTLREDGTWEVTFTLDARKLIADGEGAETPEAFAMPIEVGLLSRHPGDVSPGEDYVLALEEVTISDGEQVVTIASDEEPAYVGADPLARLIERRPDDNVEALGAGS